MKLSFSTIGCPTWSFDTIVNKAKEYKLDGIELRGLEDKIYIPNHSIFNDKNIDKVKQLLSDEKIEIPVIASGITLGLYDSYKFAKEEARDYIALANKLDVKYIRVMITPSSEPLPTDIDSAKYLYMELCEMAKEKGVCMLIETNGILSDSYTMAEFMSGTDSKAAGVLWDIHHPYRYCAEKPEKTYENLKKYIKHIHIKDSIIKYNRVEYRILGYGDIPIFDAVKLLENNGYDGYLSLEWSKRWNNDLAEPEFVLMQYRSFMDYLFSAISP